MGTHLDERRRRNSQEGCRENVRPTGSSVGCGSRENRGQEGAELTVLSALGKVTPGLIGHGIWGASPVKTPRDSKRQEGHLFRSCLGSRSLALFANHQYQIGQLCK